jgi:predicted DNA-binding transcriptional regulator YafY
MAINKNALLRYNVLDRCLRNTGRKYTFDDLKEAVSEALVEENPAYGEVSTRQLREDLRFLRSEVGYSAPIETVVEGRQRYYRYEGSFSINHSPLNETEMGQLKNAISLLRKFEGRQEFEWLNELGPILNEKLGQSEHAKPIIGFDSNLDYSGSDHIPELFNAILNKRVVEIVYQPFSGNEYTVTCHPYYLKQYNNRWFLFGRNEQLNHDQWNFPLDRIQSIRELDVQFKKDNTDWEDYFYDIIGVTRAAGQVQSIVLEFESVQVPYIQTKPLHPSQRTKMLDSGNMMVTLKLIPNFELEKEILSFGQFVKIIEPLDLRQKIKPRIIDQLSNYND